MSYRAGEALWLARLRAMSQFDHANSSRGDWSIRNNGKSAFYAILKPGMAEREMLGHTMRRDNFQTVIQLWQRYKEDGPSLIDLETLIDAVCDHLDSYPKLGDTTGALEDAQIVEIREVQQVPVNAPAWLYVELIGRWYEETTINPAG